MKIIDFIIKFIICIEVIKYCNVHSRTENYSENYPGKESRYLIISDALNYLNNELIRNLYFYNATYV